jgi:hypothetical protein
MAGSMRLSENRNRKEQQRPGELESSVISVFLLFNLPVARQARREKGKVGLTHQCKSATI